jgi:hypothetical protein
MSAGPVAATAAAVALAASVAGAGRGAVAGPSFPSYLVVPVPGCWRVTVASGAARATFVFGAFRVS